MLQWVLELSRGNLELVHTRFSWRLVTKLREAVLSIFWFHQGWKKLSTWLLIAFALSQVFFELLLNLLVFNSYLNLNIAYGQYSWVTSLNFKKVTLGSHKFLLLLIIEYILRFFIFILAFKSNIVIHRERISNLSTEFVANIDLWGFQAAWLSSILYVEQLDLLDIVLLIKV